MWIVCVGCVFCVLCVVFSHRPQGKRHRRRKRHTGAETTDWLLRFLFSSFSWLPCCCTSHNEAPTNHNTRTHAHSNSIRFHIMFDKNFVRAAHVRARPHKHQETKARARPRGGRKSDCSSERSLPPASLLLSRTVLPHGCVNHSFPFISGATARPATSSSPYFALPPTVGTPPSALYPFFSISISMSPLAPNPRTKTPTPTPTPNAQSTYANPTSPSHYLLHHHDPLGWNASGATPGSSDAALSSSRQAMRIRSEEAGP